MFIIKITELDEGVCQMLIRDIVEQALTSNYLSLEAEERLRQLLRHEYSREDLQAFMALQRAVMNCCVVQESRQVQAIAVG